MMWKTKSKGLSLSLLSLSLAVGCTPDETVEVQDLSSSARSVKHEVTHVLMADAGPDLTATVGQRVTLGALPSEEEAADLIPTRWTQIGGPLVALSDSTARNPRFKVPDFDPSTKPDGIELTFRLMITVGAGTFDTVVVTVNNHKPAVWNGRDVPVTSGEAVELTPVVSEDMDGDKLSYSWTQVDGPKASLSGRLTDTLSFVATGSPGSYRTFELEICDPYASCARDWISVVQVAEGFVDDDEDGLSNAREAALGTDPDNEDTDGDGILDGWEVHGHEEVNFPAIGCDPLKKDLLVEIDYQEFENDDGDLETMRPSETWIEAMTLFWANLDIPNPDGTSGIRLHVELDEVLDKDFICYYEASDKRGDSSMLSFERRETFHKAQFCVGNKGGRGPIHGTSVKVETPALNHAVDHWLDKDAFTLGRIFIHEMGHNLGLEHGGATGINYKPNYPSIMNYKVGQAFNDEPDTLNALVYGNRVPFSYGEMPTIDECNIDETDPFFYDVHRVGARPDAQWDYLDDWNPDFTRWHEMNPAMHGFATTSVTVDWNLNGGVDVSPYSAVVRYDRSGVLAEGDCTVLRDHNDFEILTEGLAASKRNVRGW
jgi:hypothetical protein